MVRMITKYEASDGKLFDLESDAIEYNVRLKFTNSVQNLVELERHILSLSDVDMKIIVSFITSYPTEICTIINSFITEMGDVENA